MSKNFLLNLQNVFYRCPSSSALDKESFDNFVCDSGCFRLNLIAVDNTSKSASPIFEDVLFFLNEYPRSFLQANPRCLRRYFSLSLSLVTFLMISFFTGNSDVLYLLIVARLLLSPQALSALDTPRRSQIKVLCPYVGTSFRYVHEVSDAIANRKFKLLFNCFEFILGMSHSFFLIMCWLPKIIKIIIENFG